jgi:hypothetical protein
VTIRAMRLGKTERERLASLPLDSQQSKKNHQQPSQQP